jgi:peptidoglycan/LPS O-acetylase OafA/YrhL
MLPCTPCCRVVEEAVKETCDVAPAEEAAESGTSDTDDDQLSVLDGGAELASAETKDQSFSWRTVAGFLADLWMGQRSSTAGDGKAPRLDALDGARYLASINIVLEHYYVDWSTSPPSPRLYYYGKLWTQFFFVLSGFVLGYVELARPASKAPKLSQAQYLRRRLVTIYPTYIFALLVYLLQLNKVTDFQWKMLPLSALLLQAVFPICNESPEQQPFQWIGVQQVSSHAWNIPAWFLSALVVYWLLLRPLARFFSRRSLTCSIIWVWFLWVWSLALGYVATWLPEAIGDECRGGFEMRQFLNASAVAYVHIFVAGVAMARVFVLSCMCDASTGGPPTASSGKLILKTESAPLLFRFGCCIGYVLYGLFVVFVDADEPSLKYFFHNGGLLPVQLLILIGGATGVDPIAKYIFGSRLFTFLGRISYAQYLMQDPVFTFTRTHISGEDPKKYFLFVLIPVAWLTTRFVERPYTEWQRSVRQPWMIAYIDRALERCSAVCCCCCGTPRAAEVKCSVGDERA